MRKKRKNQRMMKSWKSFKLYIKFHRKQEIFLETKSTMTVVEVIHRVLYCILNDDDDEIGAAWYNFWWYIKLYPAATLVVVVTVRLLNFFFSFFYDCWYVYGGKFSLPLKDEGKKILLYKFSIEVSECRVETPVTKTTEIASMVFWSD